ncbi:MAG: GTP pyrophosphokinase family protein [Eubacteriales bacterium]|nr:GTP pyrophosphokinase family protein [Eubacteriales bacterium]
MSDDFLDFFNKNKEPFDMLMCYYKCAIMEVETKFRVLDAEFSLQYDRNPIESIKSRIKSQTSLIKKVRDRKIPMTLESIEENINDIAGIRVICAFPKDIYMLADCLLKQDDIRLIKKKDYIENPKENGYRSLHLIVEVPVFLQNEKRNMKVEVQLRSIAMDFWASLEHKLRYKKNLSEETTAEISHELKECAEQSASLDRRMQQIRDRISDVD